MKKTHKRISAAVLSLALGFSITGAPVLAPMVAAQVSVIGPDNVSTVNPDVMGTLTIEKYIGMPVGGPGEYDTDIATKLGTLDKGYGAEFTIERLDINLTTMEGWEALENLNADNLTDATADSNFTMRTVTTGTVEDPTPGVVTVTDLPIGVYRVIETGHPTNNSEISYTPATPFYVTLPFTDEGVWNYEQTVRPKNQAEIQIDKNVTDEKVTLNKQISYTISAPVPAGNLATLRITDDLPTSLTGATNVEVFTNSGPDGDLVALPVGSVETIAEPAQNLLVTLTESGLAHLQALRASNRDLQIYVTFDTTVLSIPVSGIIENDATIDLGGDLTYSTSDNGNTVETHFGTLTINKVDSADEPIETGTARFNLYRCDSTGTAPAKYTTVGDSLATDVVTEAGTVTLDEVQVWNHVNGVDSSEAGVGEFLCVVETEAPEGYTLNPEPQRVEFTPATDDHDFAMSVNVVNLRTEDEAGGGQLPSTGGTGTMAMITGGLLVAVAGGFAALRGNRARR